MKLNMSNLIEAIYLNAFVLAQNIELQIMATRVHLSTHLLFVINLSPFQLFNAESSLQNSFRQTYQFEIPKQKNTFFSLKKRKRKKEVFQLYLVDTQNLTFLQPQYDVITLYGH